MWDMIKTGMEGKVWGKIEIVRYGDNVDDMMEGVGGKLM